MRTRCALLWIKLQQYTAERKVRGDLSLAASEVPLTRED